MKHASELELLTETLKNPAGWGVDLFDVLRAYRLEDGRFSVSEEGREEVLFEIAEEAAEYFLLRRNERKLGFDFERNLKR